MVNLTEKERQELGMLSYTSAWLVYQKLSEAIIADLGNQAIDSFGTEKSQNLMAIAKGARLFTDEVRRQMTSIQQGTVDSKTEPYNEFVESLN